MNALRQAIAAVLVTGTLALVACASVPPVQPTGGYTLDATGGISNSVPDAAFYAWLVELERKSRADPAYSRIPLGNAVQSNAFVGWVHAMYRQLMTPEQFKRQMLSLYPRHEYEIDFIIAALPPVSER